MADPLDLAIVGAGPCGLAAAVAAKERGLTHAVFDRGCITESLTHYPYYMTFFSTAERLEIGGVPFTIPEAKPTRQQALAYYRRVVAHHGLVVRQYEEVTGIDRRPGGEFTLQTRVRGGRDDRIRARAVVIATGGFGNPNRLDLEDGQPHDRVIHYYREPYPFFDQDVIVVGGGNSAVEAALELYRNGVRVRMVHFLDVFDRGVKPWVRPDIDNRVASGEIPMHWGSRVSRLGPGTATIARDEGGAATVVRGDTGAATTGLGETATATEVPCDWVVAMTGWRPDRTLLHSLGVHTDPVTGIPDHDCATMETNVPGVHIAGVIAAGFNANKIFIENGREHGALIAAAVAEGPS
ncbi:MAG: SidA/IucD/PvdA family monooxygenase [Gemmatimonadetes bacterium]|nr:SidA/IucD/PvdA family monooxygenase [Gemmatimonadota bacterium]MYI07701.1 SidA/IucD/PvdA family monooxygenase [Gemmatimonadota bacterium]